MFCVIHWFSAYMFTFMVHFVDQIVFKFIRIIVELFSISALVILTLNLDKIILTEG